MSHAVRLGLILVAATLGPVLLASPSAAQTPAPAPAPPPAIKKWTTAISLGVTLTRGNKDTATYNAGFDVKHDDKKRNILTASGLFIRGKTDGADSANRLGLNGRDEYRVNGRFFVFLQGQFLRDQFKEIDYLVAPTMGLGWNPIDRPLTKLSVNTGAGHVWEQNTGRMVKRSGAMTLGERMSHTVSPAVAVTQSFNGLWKTEHPEDALLTIIASIAATMTAKTQFKVEWIDTYKTRPPTGVKKNDMSMIVAMVVRH